MTRVFVVGAALVLMQSEAMQIPTRPTTPASKIKEAAVPSSPSFAPGRGGGGGIFFETLRVRDGVEGVHAGSGDALVNRILPRVPELASWEKWYQPPRFLANGHVHTIAASQLRATRAVAYHRQLLRTPDGGTLALDLVAGLAPPAPPSHSSAARGGGVGGFFFSKVFGAGSVATSHAAEVETNNSLACVGTCNPKQRTSCACKQGTRETLALILRLCEENT